MVCAVLAIAALATNAQRGDVEWTGDDRLSAEDKQALLQRARLLGIDDAERAESSPGPAPPLMCPCICAGASVQSRLTVDGPRRSWTQVDFVLLNRVFCREAKASLLSGELGRWLLESESAHHETRWRVADGTWFHDVSLGVGVGYEDARAIVLAIRRHEVVGAMPRRTMDAREVRSIERGTLATFAVTVDNPECPCGEVLNIDVVGQRVRVRSYGTWIALRDAPPNKRLHSTAAA